METPNHPCLTGSSLLLFKSARREAYDLLKLISLNASAQRNAELVHSINNDLQVVLQIRMKLIGTEKPIGIVE